MSTNLQTNGNHLDHTRSDLACPPEFCAALSRGNAPILPPRES